MVSTRGLNRISIAIALSSSERSTAVGKATQNSGELSRWRLVAFEIHHKTLRHLWQKPSGKLSLDFKSAFWVAFWLFSLNLGSKQRNRWQIVYIFRVCKILILCIVGPHQPFDCQISLQPTYQLKFTYLLTYVLTQNWPFRNPRFKESAKSRLSDMYVEVIFCFHSILRLKT